MHESHIARNKKKKKKVFKRITDKIFGQPIKFEEVKPFSIYFNLSDKSCVVKAKNAFLLSDGNNTKPLFFPHLPFFQFLCSLPIKYLPAKLPEKTLSSNE